MKKLYTYILGKFGKKPEINYIYSAKIIKITEPEKEAIYDGDTFSALVDVGFNTHRDIRFRLLDVDTYEVSLRNGTTLDEKKIGKEARDKLRKMLKNTTVTVKSIKKGKYGRYLAIVWAELDGEMQTIQNWLLKNNYLKKND